MLRIPDTPAAGMALMACGVSVAPVMDVCAKILTETMSPGSVAFWRFVAQLFVLAPLFVLPRHWEWPGRYHLLGGLSLAVALVAIAAAHRVMPVANKSTKDRNQTPPNFSPSFVTRRPAPARRRPHRRTAGRRSFFPIGEPCVR